LDLRIREMSRGDYEDAVRLWQESDGVRLTEVDTREAIGRYLERNPGFSLVAEAGGRLVGTILGGHDGRRGYLHHLAVHSSCRRQGIGRALVNECMARLHAAGFLKAHVFVVRANRNAKDFYSGIGWEVRDDLTLMSRRMDEAGKPTGST
jgi:ribosomal protein S18 acetylase RimI-like enzyme